MLRFSRRGEAGVTEETTAFADAMIFDGVSDELREGCVRDPGGGDAGLAQAIREGLTAAPRYLFCGAALSAPE